MLEDQGLMETFRGDKDMEEHKLHGKGDLTCQVTALQVQLPQRPVQVLLPLQHLQTPFSLFPSGRGPLCELLLISFALPPHPRPLWA